MVSVLFCVCVLESLIGSAQDQCGGDVEHAGAGEKSGGEVLANKYQ